MIVCLINFLIGVLVLALIFFLVQWVLGIAGIPIPGRIVQIVLVICALILLLSFLPCLGVGGGYAPWHWGPYR